MVKTQDLFWVARIADLRRLLGRVCRHLDFAREGARVYAANRAH